MNRYLKMLFAAVLLIGLAAGTSFAVPVSFTDTIMTPDESGWTHILDNSDFTPNLVAGDSITVTDALLIIVMDYKRVGTSTKLFQITAKGDTILLDTFNSSGSAGNVNDALWSIDLSDAATALQAISDRSFAVALYVGTGEIKDIDSATLSGNATVVQADPIEPDPIEPNNVPEPSTFLLLSAGLAGVGIFKRKI